MGVALLLRHASAGKRFDWSGEDALRPLDGRGREQAATLPRSLPSVPVRRIVSSPAVRCVQTVEPLARALGVRVERHADLAEGAPRDASLALVLELGPGAVSCTHGDVLHALTGHAGAKGGGFVVELRGDGLAVVQDF